MISVFLTIIDTEHRYGMSIHTEYWYYVFIIVIEPMDMEKSHC